MVKAIVFDIGNVLLNWDPDLLYRELIPDPKDRAEFFARTNVATMNELVDRGAPFKETVYAWADQFPDDRDLIRAWHDRWLDMSKPLIGGSWQILRHFRATEMPVFALSNFGCESFELAERTYPEFAEFDHRVISGFVRMIKPEARIYKHLEDVTGFSGSDLYFIDDRADNIEAANQCGWITHRFSDPETLLADLQSKHVIGGTLETL